MGITPRDGVVFIVIDHKTFRFTEHYGSLCFSPERQLSPIVVKMPRGISPTIGGRMKVISLVLTGLLLTSAALADHEGRCSSQRTQFLIRAHDLSSAEFQASASDPRAVFTLYNYNPTTLTSH